MFYVNFLRSQTTRAELFGLQNYVWTTPVTHGVTETNRLVLHPLCRAPAVRPRRPGLTKVSGRLQRVRAPPLRHTAPGELKAAGPADPGGGGGVPSGLHEASPHAHASRAFRGTSAAPGTACPRPSASLPGLPRRPHRLVSWLAALVIVCAWGLHLHRGPCGHTPVSTEAQVWPLGPRARPGWLLAAPAATVCPGTGWKELLQSLPSNSPSWFCSVTVTVTHRR